MLVTETFFFTHTLTRARKKIHTLEKISTLQFQEQVFKQLFWAVEDL